MAKETKENKASSPFSQYEGLGAFESIIKALGIGAMAYGQGMTGQPFYTNYQNQQSGTADRAFEQWKAQQGIDLEQQKLDTEKSLKQKEYKKEFQQHLLGLKSKYGRNKDRALKDFKEDLPLLRDMYGDMYEDFDKEAMGMFDSLYSNVKAKKPRTSTSPILDTGFGVPQAQQLGMQLRQNPMVQQMMQGNQNPSMNRMGMAAKAAINPVGAMDEFLVKKSLGLGRAFGQGLYGQQ